MCVRLVHKATGLNLDGSPDTLPLLDHYLVQLRPEKEEIRNLVAAAAGAYFGELVRARFPCRWHAPPEDYGAWRIEFGHVFLHFNPIAFAHEAILRAEVVEGGAGFGVLDRDLDALREGLEALGSIGEEDYYRLSTRYEVLATLVDRLTARKLTSANPTESFDATVYRMALDTDPDDKPS